MAQRAWRDAVKFKGKGGSKGETYRRNVNSLLRVALAQYYGSADWMHLLLAVGSEGINADMVEAYNAVIDRRTPGGAHGPEPHEGPRLSERALAAAQGVEPQDWPPVSGVQHTKSNAQLARKRANRLDKAWRDAQHALRRWSTQREREEVERLRNEATAAWAEADELSSARGFAYWGREGQRVNPEQDKRSMVTDVLRTYADKLGLEYDGPALGPAADPPAGSS